MTPHTTAPAGRLAALDATDDPEEGAQPDGRPRAFIQSLERGLAIIRCFGVEAPRQTVSELAARTGLTRATVRRFLITLIELGYVETDGRTFRLTPRVLELGYAFLSGLGLPEVIRPHLERLVAEVDECSEASILDGDEVVCIARVPGRTLMTIAVNVGTRMPAHATSMGKVLLGDLSEADLEAHLAKGPFTRCMPRTATTPEALRRQIVEARRQGCAIADEELEEGLLAIAVPVRDRHGRIVAAINLSTHAARHDAASLRERLLEPLRRAAQMIELDIAGAPG